MMLYVYALCDSPSPALTGMNGLEKQPLEALEVPPVAAVYSRHYSPRLPPTPDNAWCQEAVIETLLPDRAVLPVRFGTTFPDSDSLRAVLMRHRTLLGAGLARVRGFVELGVRFLWTLPEELPAKGAASGEAPRTGQSGRSYLLARLAEEQHWRRCAEQARGLAESLHNQLAATAADCTRQLTAATEHLLSGVYLVPRAAIDAFRQRFTELGRASPRLRLLCTGPWPPYHFVPRIPLPEPSHA